jgi:hypothetical protein
MVQSVVTEREAIAFEIAEIVGDVADKWGVAIEGILIKDIIFSPEVSASLSSAAQQKRIGESKVIAARAEVDSARLMRQAAEYVLGPLHTCSSADFLWLPVSLRPPLLCRYVNWKHVRRGLITKYTSIISLSLQCNKWLRVRIARSYLFPCNSKATSSARWRAPRAIQAVARFVMLADPIAWVAAARQLFSTVCLRFEFRLWMS